MVSFFLALLEFQAEVVSLEPLEHEDHQKLYEFFIALDKFHLKLMMLILCPHQNSQHFPKSQKMIIILIEIVDLKLST